MSTDAEQECASNGVLFCHSCQTYGDHDFFPKSLDVDPVVLECAVRDLSPPANGGGFSIQRIPNFRFGPSLDAVGAASPNRQQSPSKIDMIVTTFRFYDSTVPGGDNAFRPHRSFVWLMFPRHDTESRIESEPVILSVVQALMSQWAKEDLSLDVTEKSLEKKRLGLVAILTGLTEEHKKQMPMQMSDRDIVSLQQREKTSAIVIYQDNAETLFAGQVQTMLRKVHPRAFDRVYNVSRGIVDDPDLLKAVLSSDACRLWGFILFSPRKAEAFYHLDPNCCFVPILDL